MKDANDSLERDIAAGRGRDVRVDDVGDGDGRYIEMVLYSPFFLLSFFMLMYGELTVYSIAELGVGRFGREAG